MAHELLQCRTQLFITSSLLTSLFQFQFGKASKMISRSVQLEPSSICNTVNKFDHVSTQNCDALPHNLQWLLIFFCLSHILHVVIAITVTRWQRFPWGLALPGVYQRKHGRRPMMATTSSLLAAPLSFLGDVAEVGVSLDQLWYRRRHEMRHVVLNCAHELQYSFKLPSELYLLLKFGR